MTSLFPPKIVSLITQKLSIFADNIVNIKVASGDQEHVCEISRVYTTLSPRYDDFSKIWKIEIFIFNI